MFISQTINNQYNINNLNFQTQPNYMNATTQPQITNFGTKEQEELEMLRKMDEEARKEKTKTNQNLSKLLSLIEVHNGTLEEIEQKFKREFNDIKDNISKIKKQQEEQEKMRKQEKIERVQYERRNNKGSQPKYQGRSSSSEEEKDEKYPKKVDTKKKLRNKDLKVEDKDEMNLEKLYPKSNQSASNHDFSHSITNDDIGLYAIPQNVNANVNALNLQDKRVQKEAKKRVTKKAPEAKKKSGKNVHRENTSSHFGVSNAPILVEGSKKGKQKSEENKERSREESPSPELTKLDSNAYMINNNKEEEHHELNLTDEEEENQDDEIKEIDDQSNESSHHSSEESSEEESDNEENDHSDNEEEKVSEHKTERRKNKDQRKFSDVSFEESSIEGNNEDDINHDNQMAYQENMPRLNQDGTIPEDKKPKKKKRKIKFKRGNKQNHQEMDVMMREQVNKKEKANLARKSQAKKSYHAYLEHPRMRHQPSYQSPRRMKAEETDPISLAPRPKKK